jgi:hypothetical protein
MQAVLKPPEQAKVGGGETGKYDTKKRVTTISWIPFCKVTADV